jgi:hypothetical protein
MTDTPNETNAEPRSAGGSTVTTSTGAAPQAVWDVLADGWTYATWVVGTCRIRGVDPDFPAVGSTIHHAFGMWPLYVSDQTVVEVVEPGRTLGLLAKGGPLGAARIRLVVAAEGTGSRVTLYEDAVDGPGAAAPHAVRAPLIRARNRETLRRLAWLAEGRDRRHAGDVTPTTT